MDAVALLGSDALFVIDTSAWWRTEKLVGEIRELVRGAVSDRRVLVTPIVRMEMLYSARARSEYVELEEELDALRTLRNDRVVADAAMRAVGELAERGDGYHRVPVTDALIAAAASEHGGLAVVHRDARARLAEVLAFESVTLPAP